MTTILKSLPDFYAIKVVNGDGPSFAVSVVEIPIIAWSYDDSVTPPTMTAITVGGLLPSQYVAHPESRYVDVKNNIVWDSLESFRSSLQEIYDMARADVPGEPITPEGDTNG